MNPLELLRSALGEVRGHPMRSGLTLLGIVLGTLSITVMTSFLDGIVSTVWSGFRDLGFDGVMYVVPRQPRDAAEAALFARSEGLTVRDAAAIAARGGIVSAVAPVLQSQDAVAAGGRERRVAVFGVTADYAPLRQRTVGAGRFLVEADEERAQRVAVLGWRLARTLFGSDDPLGKTVAIGGRGFRVVGVAARLGNRFVHDGDSVEEMEGVYVPLATLRQFYAGRETSLSYIAVKTRQVDRLDDLRGEVEAALLTTHHGARDFRVANIAEEILKARAQVKDLLRNWRIVLGTIAGVSLVVGGIGLMSVMLISLGERLFEIGLRKASGATDGAIFVQFLAESVTLALLGGVTGVAAGIGVTRAFASFFPDGLPVRVDGVLFALGLAILLGVAYGAYPAIKAARLAPAEALRNT